MSYTNYYDAAERRERSNSDAALSGHIQRMQSVVEGLGRFLEEQLHRLERAANQCEEMISQKRTVERNLSELDQERNEFEREREKQIADIRQEQDRLIEAWHRLEGEQRRVLSQKDATPSMRETVSFSRKAATTATLPETPTSTPTLPLEQPEYGEPARTRPVASVSRESALEQFQRLKREIRNHVQRVQRTPQNNGNH